MQGLGSIKQRNMIKIGNKELRHVIVAGCDWYVEADFHEGQKGDHLNPPMDDYWEVINIYNSEGQMLELGTVYEELEYEIERKL